MDDYEERLRRLELFARYTILIGGLIGLVWVVNKFNGPATEDDVCETKEEVSGSS